MLEYTLLYHLINRRLNGNHRPSTFYISFSSHIGLAGIILSSCFFSVPQTNVGWNFEVDQDVLYLILDSCTLHLV